jgi:hypothetical protein
MKKYNLGALTVKDSELCDTKEEIVVEILDRLGKYVVAADAVAKDGSRTLEERLEGVRYVSSAFSGLSNFLSQNMKIEIRDPDGTLTTQTMFNRIYYHETMLKVEIRRREEERS